MSFAVHGDITSGPGIVDMKCGLVQGFWGIKVLCEAAGVDRQVVLLCNSDEELGSPHSRSLIEESARDSRASLVLEPSLEQFSKRMVPLIETRRVLGLVY